MTMAEVSAEPKLCYKPVDDLLNVKVKDIVDAQAQIPALLRVSDTIEFALEILGSNNILSAPVLDIEEKVVLGFVDYVDLAAYLADNMNNKQLSQDDKKLLLSRSLRHAGILDLSNRDPFIIVLGKHPASILVQGFNSGLHRVVFFDDESKISGICSQSDVLRFVHKKISSSEVSPDLDKFLSCPLDRLGWGQRSVISVQKSASLLDCLITLHQHHISNLAIIDQHNHLIGNFSASDLRGLSSDFITFLNSEVFEFLALKSKKSLSPKTIARDTTVREVFNELATQKLHHVWITDAEGHPTGIVTLTDVMSGLYSFDPEPPRLCLPTPGFLEVEILQARNLQSGWFGCDPYILVRFPDRPRSSFQTTVGNSTNPVWSGQKFRIPIAARNYHDRVLFMVKDRHMLGKDDDLGFFVLRLDWVLNGFGTSSSTVITMCDWFGLMSKDPIDDVQGEVEVRMTYKLFD
jgi:CBS-domain-containing membrane protein